MVTMAMEAVEVQGPSRFNAHGAGGGGETNVSHKGLLVDVASCRACAAISR